MSRIITFNDLVLGQGFTSQLSFDSPTTGTIFLRKLGSTGYQTGVFSMTTPSIPPTITTHPANQTVNVGVNVSFSVSAIGTPPLAFQWRKNRVNINGANATSYTIASAQASDQGDYDVVVSNPAGSISSSAATLVVLIPPSISVQPSGLTVFVGASATFSVTAAGSAPLSYQWRKNSIDIAGAKLASYTIGNVQVSDAGSYSVRVSNAAGSTNSNPATLLVNLVAPSAPAFSAPRWSQSGGWGIPRGFSAMLQTQSQTAYRIQYSTNLVTWFDLTNLIATGTSMPVSDPGSITVRARFCRAVSP